MNSHRKINKSLLAFAVMLFFGAGAISLSLLPEQDLAEMRPAREGQVPTRQQQKQIGDEHGKDAPSVQVAGGNALLTGEKNEQNQRVAGHNESQPQTREIKTTETVSGRIQHARDLPDAKEEQEIAGLGESEIRPDHPDDAARFRRLQMQDENGLIPSDGLERARQHIARMKVAQQERIKANTKNGRPSSQDTNSAGIKRDSWSWLGPGNIGGRIRSIAIHPTNANTIWVGSVSGGIWRTDDGGLSWQPVDDFMANLAVSTIVINPIDSNIMYAGTGEAVSVEGIQGAGVFRSTDGGVTWNQLTSTNDQFWFHVSRLAISPDGNTILAATDVGTWRSTDSGTNWTAVGTDIQAFDVDFDPTDSSQAVAGEEGSAEFSTDGGETWAMATFSPRIQGRVELAYAPSNHNAVYASVNQNQGEIYKSSDGGRKYRLVNSGEGFLGSQGEYANIIWVNPCQANFVIVGGRDLWRSTDNGLSLTQISKWQAAPKSAHADHHMIVAHPGFDDTTNRIVFFGNDGGIYSTSDVKAVSLTSGWKELNNGLGITQFYGAAGNADTGVIIGGTQDNGTNGTSRGRLRYTPTGGGVLDIGAPP